MLALLIVLAARFRFLVGVAQHLRLVGGALLGGLSLGGFGLTLRRFCFFLGFGLGARLGRLFFRGALSSSPACENFSASACAASLLAAAVLGLYIQLINAMAHNAPRLGPLTADRMTSSQALVVWDRGLPKVAAI